MVTSRRNKLRLILCALFFCIFNLQLTAQQDPMFSQYMFNKMLINPGYAGSTNSFNAALAYRKQFIGLQGAPQIQAITIDAPFKSKTMGFGIKAIHESIGATSQNEVTIAYAYHLNMAKGKLSLGVEGGLFNQAIDFSNLRKTIQEDNAIPLGKENIIVPDAGFGFYYASTKLYLGGASYHLLQNKLNFSGYTGQDRTVIAKLSNHSYLLAGYNIQPQANIWIAPSLLLKYVSGAPLQIDLNVNATFKDAITIGGTYRSNNAIVFLFQYNFKERFQFGYAFDYVISDLSAYGFNTHGVMLSYHIPSGKTTPEPEEEEEETVPEILTPVDSLTEDSLSTKTIEPTPAEIAVIRKKMDSLVSVLTEEKKEIIPEIEDTVSTEQNLDSEKEPLEDMLSTEPPGDTSSAESSGDVSGTEPPEEEKVTFKIQLLVKREPIFMTPVNFKGLENIEEYEEAGLFKYVVGLADNYVYAKDVLLNEVKLQGFPDAFIVAFYKGQKISVQEAIKLSEKP